MTPTAPRGWRKLEFLHIPTIPNIPTIRAMVPSRSSQDAERLATCGAVEASQQAETELPR